MSPPLARARSAHLVVPVKPIWVRRSSGYGDRLVTETVLLWKPSGYGDRLVTETVWSRKPKIQKYTNIYE